MPQCFSIILRNVPFFGASKCWVWMKTQQAWSGRLAWVLGKFWATSMSFGWLENFEWWTLSGELGSVGNLGATCMSFGWLVSFEFELWAVSLGQLLSFGLLACTVVRPALWICGGKPCSFHIRSLPSNIKAKLPAAGNFSLKQRVKTSKLVNFTLKV